MRKRNSKSSGAQGTSLKDTKRKNTKWALVSSMLALVLCCAMLIGTTFAWFTDSVTSGRNKIVAGNLDVELYAKDSASGEYTPVTADSNLFMEDALWEPGHVEVVNLKVANLGTLALKYQFSVNIASEIGSINAAGKEFKLSDYIRFAVVDGDQTYTGDTARDAAIAAAETAGSTTISALNVNNQGELYPENTEGKDSEKCVTLIVYMPTTVGNEANYRTGETAPEISLGVNLVATQMPYESDSFGDDYDELAASEENMKLIELEAQGWTLVDSVSDIDGDGKYILTEEITDAVTLTASDSLVLDLNGQTMSGSVSVNGNVTIVDSSDEKTGAVTNRNKLSVKANSTLTVEAGTYVGFNPAAAATIIVNGGTITGQSYGNKGMWIINDGHFSSTGTLFTMTQGESVTIHGGVFDGIVNFGNKANPATVTIDGGTFNSDVSATYGTWNINGGEFNGPVYASVPTNATCNINGGTFNHTGNKCGHGNSHYMFYGNSSNAENYYKGYTITAGSFKTDPTNYMNDNSGTVTQDGTTGYYVVK